MIGWKFVSLNIANIEAAHMGLMITTFYTAVTETASEILKKKNPSVMGKTAGAKTASLGGCFHSSKTRARWMEGFHDELNGHIFDLEMDGPHQVVPCPSVTMR